ncbi:hypothetical protein, partial [Aeromonas hydrophila]|uniref:hypothetical protein n=1 Tax=Aeromonas hydrophila TaxID=644 RepID=UPI0020B27D8F
DQGGAAQQAGQETRHVAATQKGKSHGPRLDEESIEQKKVGHTTQSHLNLIVGTRGGMGGCRGLEIPKSKDGPQAAFVCHRR